MRQNHSVAAIVGADGRPAAEQPNGKRVFFGPEVTEEMSHKDRAAYAVVLSESFNNLARDAFSEQNAHEEGIDPAINSQPKQSSQAVEAKKAEIIARDQVGTELLASIRTLNENKVRLLASRFAYQLQHGQNPSKKDIKFFVDYAIATEPTFAYASGDNGHDSRDVKKDMLTCYVLYAKEYGNEVRDIHRTIRERNSLNEPILEEEDIAEILTGLEGLQNPVSQRMAAPYGKLLMANNTDEVFRISHELRYYLKDLNLDTAVEEGADKEGLKKAIANFNYPYSIIATKIQSRFRVIQARNKVNQERAAKNKTSNVDETQEGSRSSGEEGRNLEGRNLEDISIISGDQNEEDNISLQSGEGRFDEDDEDISVASVRQVGGRNREENDFDDDQTERSDDENGDAISVASAGEVRERNRRRNHLRDDQTERSDDYYDDETERSDDDYYDEEEDYDQYDPAYDDVDSNSLEAIIKDLLKSNEGNRGDAQIAKMLDLASAIIKPDRSIDGDKAKEMWNHLHAMEEEGYTFENNLIKAFEKELKKKGIILENPKPPILSSDEIELELDGLASSRKYLSIPDYDATRHPVSWEEMERSGLLKGSVRLPQGKLELEDNGFLCTRYKGVEGNALFDHDFENIRMNASRGMTTAAVRYVIIDDYKARKDWESPSSIGCIIHVGEQGISKIYVDVDVMEEIKKNYYNYQYAISLASISQISNKFFSTPPQNISDDVIRRHALIGNISCALKVIGDYKFLDGEERFAQIKSDLESFDKKVKEAKSYDEYVKLLEENSDLLEERVGEMALMIPENSRSAIRSKVLEIQQKNLEKALDRNRDINLSTEFSVSPFPELAAKVAMMQTVEPEKAKDLVEKVALMKREIGKISNPSELKSFLEKNCQLLNSEVEEGIKGIAPENLTKINAGVENRKKEEITEYSELLESRRQQIQLRAQANAVHAGEATMLKDIKQRNDTFERLSKLNNEQLNEETAKHFSFMAPKQRQAYKQLLGARMPDIVRNSSSVLRDRKDENGFSIENIVTACFDGNGKKDLLYLYVPGTDSFIQVRKMRHSGPAQIFDKNGRETKKAFESGDIVISEASFKRNPDTGEYYPTKVTDTEKYWREQMQIKVVSHDERSIESSKLTSVTTLTMMNGVVRKMKSSVVQVEAGMIKDHESFNVPIEQVYNAEGEVVAVLKSRATTEGKYLNLHDSYFLEYKDAEGKTAQTTFSEEGLKKAGYQGDAYDKLKDLKARLQDSNRRIEVSTVGDRKTPGKLAISHISLALPSCETRPVEVTDVRKQNIVFRALERIGEELLDLTGIDDPLMKEALQKQQLEQELKGIAAKMTEKGTANQTRRAQPTTTTINVGGRG